MEASLLERGRRRGAGALRASRRCGRGTTRRCACGREGGRTEQVARELNERRSEYERSLAQLELARARPGAGGRQRRARDLARRRTRRPSRPTSRSSGDYEAEQRPYEEGLRAARAALRGAARAVRRGGRGDPRGAAEGAAAVRGALQGDPGSDFQEQCAEEREQVVGGGRPAHPRHRAARERAASTTSCAAAPAARAIPARRASTSRSRTTCCASSAPTACRA